MLTSAIKPKVCAMCPREFIPRASFATCCSQRCAMRKVKADKAAERTRDKERKEALKPIRKILSETQSIFNAWVRKRDQHLPCISCGRFHQGEWHAGHYLSTGARSELRFDEANVHKQCQPCNVHLSGNLIAYRIGLLMRVGAAEVARLESSSAVHKWTRPELESIKATYRAKLRELEKAE